LKKNNLLFFILGYNKLYNPSKGKKMNEFKLAILENQIEIIFEKYKELKDQEKIRIDNCSKCDKEKEWATLGRFKKMAKNEVISLYLEQHKNLFNGYSKSIVLRAFKSVFNRQPNQNNPLLDRLSEKKITVRKINRSNYTEMLKTLEKEMRLTEDFELFKKWLEPDIWW
jgi:hypothetical protein